MGKFVIAKQLAGKKLITNDGEEIGKFVDAYVSEVTGKIESLIVEPNVDNPIVRKMKREEGMLLIPYTAVLAVSDHIILDKKVL